MPQWSEEDRERLGASAELQITAPRPDGSSPAPVPIWVVVAGEDVFVRTWYRRDTGWYGHAVASGRATIAVPGLQTDVDVDHVGAGEGRHTVDDAYRATYGPTGHTSMVTDEAAATTLRLRPRGDRPPPG